MKKNALEWSVFGVSLLVIAACIGILLYEQVTRTDLPPSLEAEVGEIREQDGSFAVEVRVHNAGDRTAAAVHLELIGGSGERAEAVVEYVPHRSTRRAWMMLRSDPRPGVIVRVVGFEEP